MTPPGVADVSWIKRKLRPHLFKAWEWSCGGFDGDDGGLMHDYWKWYDDGERRGWKYQSPYNR